MINGHGDDKYRYDCPITADFSSNTCTLLNTTPLKQHLQHCLDSIDHYPEPEPRTLEQLVARQTGLEASQVMVTAGATEGIYLVAQTFAGSNSSVLQPTFGEYADAARIHRHQVSVRYSLPDASTGYRLPATVQLLWLCNPNNPTGAVIPPEQLYSLIEANPHTCFVIDCSYEDFCVATLPTANRLASYPNVLALHSLTKRFAIPGLRLGYITGADPLLHRLRLQRMPWSVNALALEAGQYICTHPELFQLPLGHLLECAQLLAQQLTRTRMIEVWPSHTHFMLARLRTGHATALKEYLARQHGLLIRDASNFHGLSPAHFRVATLGTAADRQLVDAITQWFALS